MCACPVTDLGFGGARGGSKTYGFLGEWLLHSNAWGAHARGLFFRRTYEELADVQHKAERLYPRAGGRWAASKREWAFRNGSALQMRYLKRDADAQNYMGHEYTRIYGDEIGNFASPDPIDKLLACLRSPAGVPVGFRGSMNPGGPGHAWLKERYIDPAPPMTPFSDPVSGMDRVFIPARLEDNPYLRDDAGYRNRIKSVGPPWLVQAWLHGDWNVTPEGGLILAKWLQQRFDELPSPYIRIVQSWDTAQKDNELTNDPSACTTWIETAHGYYLVHCWTGWVDFPALLRSIRHWADQYNPDVVLIEDKGSGTAAIQQLKDSTRLPIIPVIPTRDKSFRLQGVSSLFEAGLVMLPKHAPWLLDYEIELTTFPLSAHDDRVDSTSQALAYMSGSAGDGFSMIQTAGRRTSTSAYR